MQPIKIAVAGTGFSQRTILPVLSEIGLADVLALSGGEDRAKTERIAGKFHVPVWQGDFEQMCSLPNLDLVFIASPHAYHFEMVDTALDRDLHIVCEKPLALNEPDIVTLIRKAERSDRLHLVNHQLRFSPHILKSMELLRDGKIGRPYAVRVHFQTDRLVCREGVNRWWFEPKEGGGMLLAMASHMIDILQLWFGMQFEEVSAELDPILDTIPGLDGLCPSSLAESFFCARFRLSNGVTAELFCTGVSFRESRLAISIYGTEGELEFRAPGDLVLYRFTPKGRSEGVRIQPENGSSGSGNGESLFHSSFRIFAHTLVHAIASGGCDDIRERATDFRDYLVKFRLIESIRESARRRTTIRLGD